MNSETLIEQISAAFGEGITNIFVRFGSALKDLLGAIPIPAARIALAVLFLALAIWCLTLPKEAATKDTQKLSRWNDPRLWAALLLLTQIILYLSV